MEQGQQVGRSKLSWKKVQKGVTSLRKYKVSFLFVYSFHCFLLPGNVYKWLTLKLVLQLPDGKDNTSNTTSKSMSFH